MPVKIVVVGDVLAHLTAATERLPRPYQTVDGHNFWQGATGTGARQAVAAARLGAAVTFVGRVGDDANGALVRRLFDAEGVDTAFLGQDDAHPTGVLLGFAETDKKMMHARVPGANERLSGLHIKAAEPAIAAADALVSQLAVPLGAVERALQVAQAHGVQSILKPTPFTPVAEQLLMLATVLTPNEEELRGLAHHTDIRRTAPQQTSVCTLGAAGAQWFRQQGGRMGTGRVAGFPVRVVDAFGAGDVFSAALGVALAEEKPLEEAIRFANAAGAEMTTVQGGWGAIPTRQAVDARLASG